MKTIINNNVMMDEKIINRNIILGTCIFTFILSFLIVFRAFPSVWNDEAASIQIFSSNWEDMWEYITKADVHPPLYYIIMKLMGYPFHYDFQAIKIIQILPNNLLHLLIAYIVVKNKVIYIKSTGLLTALYIACTTFQMDFLIQSVEIRMYSFAMFFVTISGIFAYLIIFHWINEEEKTAEKYAFVIFSLSACLTHYYALFCVVFIYAFVLILIVASKKPARKKLRFSLSILFPIILGYLWWIPFAFRQASESNSIIDGWLNFSYTDISGYIEGFMVGETKIELILIGIIAFEAIRQVYFSDNINEYISKMTIIGFGLFFMALPIFIIVVGSVISVVYKPFITDRYIFPAMGLFWIGIVLLLSQVKNYRQWIYGGVLAGIVLLMMINNYPSVLKKERETGSRKIVEYIHENSDNEDLLISDIGHLKNRLLAFYFPNYEVSGSEDLVEKIKDRDIFMFVYQDKEVDWDSFINNNMAVSKVFTGDFDSVYYVDVYKITKK